MNWRRLCWPRADEELSMAKKTPKPSADKAFKEDLRPRLSAHPRARRQINETKAWAGVVGFVLVCLLSMQADVPLPDALLRALTAGVVCYIVGWAIAVAVWRHLARAEVLVAQQRVTAESPPQP
jgi:protein-S-isoprenylcysteine O-methyltransferase Ste14